MDAGPLLRPLYFLLPSLAFAADPASNESTFKSIALPPEAAIAGMELPAGYHLELVLAEPDVEEPVLAVFDGNGRMYVAEMRTYMLDADGTDKFEPVSRVSLHEDTTGDGHYDRHTVFADNLLLPRMVLPLKNSVIIGETNTLDLYEYTDTDGDGVADEKSLWFEGGPRGGNLEHQPSGLIWALDNWLYTTYNDFRLRYAHGEVQRETIPLNNGQWGLTQDDFGKVWYVRAGSEIGPVHFQQHILYGQFHLEGERAPDYKTVWPIDNIPDTQGGRAILREDNTLNHFTATCGQDVFRGDRLPADLRGDLLFAEPVGRLIRRTKISIHDGITQLSNAYPQSEFIRTTDPLFRPVNMVTAPDGTLYIVDMYRGIIQEGQWTPKGSYLREQIEKYGFEKEIGRGRIYRLVHDDFGKGPQPKMLAETPADWVKHLAHPNGWWRDTAQKLLILEGDKSVVPALRSLAIDSSNRQARLHALWTLEGLDELTVADVSAALDAPDPEIQKTALRLSEGWLGTHVDLTDQVASLLQHEDPSVVIQTVLSLQRADVPNAEELARATAKASDSAGVYAITEQTWADDAEDPYLLPMLGAEGLKAYRAGRTFYDSLCFACHGSDGQGMAGAGDRTLAPPLAGSPRVLGNKDAAIAILLHGFNGLVDGVDYGAPMVPMNTYADEELANVLTYVRNSFGNRSSQVTATEIAEARVKHADRSEFWTIEDLTGAVPSLQVPDTAFVRRDEWQVNANFANYLACNAVDDDPQSAYITRRIAYPGQWFSIRLPAESTLKSIVIDASTAENPSFPPRYEVHVSSDGQNWGTAIASGAGEPVTQIHLEEPAQATWVRITVTHRQGWGAWVINDLQLFGQEG